MVQILQRSPSFGEQLAKGMGEGFGRGLDTASQFAMKMGMEKYKSDKRQKLIQEIESGGSQGSPSDAGDIKNKFLEMLPQLDQAKQAEKGEGLTPQELDEIWNHMNPSEKFSQQMQEDPFAKAKKYAAAGEPELAAVAREEARLSEKNKSHALESEEKRERGSEKGISKIQDKIESLEDSGLRFEKLNELFSPEKEIKFPPSVMSAIFSKNGEIIPTMLSQLSPEAQESIKLLADEINGAKETFGSRVTNFDLERYLKRLPSLINTPEGRRKILTDLRIMNKLNLMRNQGVLDVMEREGGAGKISLTKAREMWKKENSKKTANLKKMFMNPDKAEINELDEFSASIFPGKVIEDEETGQRFRSNGNEWEMI